MRAKVGNMAGTRLVEDLEGHLREFEFHLSVMGSHQRAVGGKQCGPTGCLENGSDWGKSKDRTGGRRLSPSP